MKKQKDITQLNTRYFTIISDNLELEIRAGKCVQRGWHTNIFPGMWVYEVEDKTIQLQQTDKTGFCMEAMIL